MNPALLAAAPLPPARSALLALAGLALAVLLSTLNTSLVNVALPTLADVFHVSMPAVQWTVVAYVLAITTLIVSAGRLADLVGRKRLLLGGVALFTTAAVACGLAPNFGGLIAARFVQGFGAAVMMALSVALIGQLTGGATAGRAMGLLGSMSAVGTALGPALGGGLIAAFGWRALFFVNVPLGLVAFVLLARALPADEPAPVAKLRDFDAFGTLLLGAGLAAYALGVTRGPHGFSLFHVALLAFAVGALAWFVITQRNARSPLIRLELLTSSVLRSSLAMTLLVATVMMTTLIVGPFYLSRALHVGPALNGLALSLGPVAAALTAVPAGRLVDRIGSARATLLGLGATALGCAALVFLPRALGLAGYIVPVAVMTSGYSLFQTANNTAVMQLAAPDQRGVIAGLLNLARNLGLVTGASLLGAVFAFVADDLAHATPAFVTSAMRATFAVATVFLLVALVLAFRATGRLSFGRFNPLSRRIAGSRLIAATPSP